MFINSWFAAKEIGDKAIYHMMLSYLIWYKAEYDYYPKVDKIKANLVDSGFHNSEVIINEFVNWCCVDLKKTNGRFKLREEYATFAYKTKEEVLEANEKYWDGV